MSTVIILLPLATLLILAVVTKKMERALIAASILALALLNKQNIVRGTLESFYRVLSDDSFQFCIIFLTTFGIIMKLFQASGGLQGFAQLVKRYATGKKRVMVFCWIMDVLLFIDEYLNTLTVSFSMRSVTDREGIPREHLAFHVASMGCSLCLAVPMTSWTAFIVNVIEDYDMSYGDYLRCVPLMFYPILLILLCLLLAVGWFPKIGLLKKAYERVDAGGPALIHEKNEKALVDLGEYDETNISSPANILVPMLVIIAGGIYFDRNMLLGLILGIVCQFMLYIPGKTMKMEQFFDHMFAGASSMLPLLMILFFGYVLNDCNEQLGLFDVVVSFAGSTLPAGILPVVTFLGVGALVFATGSCWLMLLLAIPIFIPLAIQIGADPVLTLAAILSGVGLGYSTCFYGDVIFLTAAGTELGNMTIIRVAYPYAIILMGISAIGYLVLGVLL